MMKLLVSLLLIACVAPFLVCEENLDYFALDDPAFTNEIMDMGFYGRFLELRGENEKAVEYYRSETGKINPESARLPYLEWYLGYSSMPTFTDSRSLKNLILQYLSTGEKSVLEEMEKAFPHSFELIALKSGNMFLMPFLFSGTDELTQENEQDVPESIETVAAAEVQEESAERIETKNGIPWSYEETESVEAIEPDAPEVLIQLGSFRFRNNAEQHLKELTKKGIDAEIEEKRNGEELFYITVMPAGNDIQHSLLELKEKGLEGFPLYP